ncbi:MAG: YdiU family protein [Planctomycetaceae bacterium]|nr:YdiU family protein [Planctomycetaceae bacterium]
MPEDFGWNFQNTYTQLPDVFYREAKPVRVRSPQLCVVNRRLADELGLRISGVPDRDLAAVFTGQAIPDGAQPIAQAYAGHQFGGFTMLGDGRAILLGEQQTPSGELRDIQFKGAGQTAFSRRGDGRAALGPMLREYLISEAMHALGIPTTRSLAVATTGEAVLREKPLRGAVLTRIAASHIRVGTFQFAAVLKETDKLRALADYSIARHDPELADTPDRYLRFLNAVAERQARLIAQWQLTGFIHGVMNTDNMAISGETIDYGPCAFMDRYDPATVFSSIDHGGRYAYGNQPGIGQWNLARFAETLLPLLSDDREVAIERAMEVLNRYPELYEQSWLSGMRKKLGLETEHEEDETLIQDLLDWMESTDADFTNTFFDLSSQNERTVAETRDDVFVEWFGRLQQRWLQEGQTAEAAQRRMSTVNPWLIPRNHRVEEALSAAADQNDLSVMQRLLDALSLPYECRPEYAEFREPAPAGQSYRTFCGT